MITLAEREAMRIADAEIDAEMSAERKGKGMGTRVYSFYSKVSGELLCSGTASELVKQGRYKSTASVMSQASRAARGKLKKVECFVDKMEPTP